MSSVLNKYVPLKKVEKCNLTFKTKPWIIPGIQK